MTFFRSLPPEGWDPDLPSPLAHIAYTTMFFGPLSGGIIIGYGFGGYAGLAISLPVSGVIWLASAVLFDRVVHKWIARFQKTTSLFPHVLVNVVGIAWAIGLTAFSMFATGFLVVRLGI